MKWKKAGCIGSKGGEMKGRRDEREERAREERGKGGEGKGRRDEREER